MKYNNFRPPVSVFKVWTKRAQKSYMSRQNRAQVLCGSHRRMKEYRRYYLRKEAILQTKQTPKGKQEEKENGPSQDRSERDR